MKKLTRDMKNKSIGGVASGFAKYFSIDVTIVRLGLVFLLLAFPFATAIAYLVAMAIMPEK